MKRATIFFMFAFLFAFGVGASAQTFDGEWSCEYATYDDPTNGTGYQTIDVAAFAENQFVALVHATSAPNYYYVAYTDADSANGRMEEVPYTPSAGEWDTPWSDVFTTINLYDARALANNLNEPNPGYFYVANNDEDDLTITGPGGNILVFNFGLLGVESTDKRLATGKELWAIDVDDSGRVYVTARDEGELWEVVVYDNVANEVSWSDASETPTPLQSFAVPDTGDLRGVAVNADGSALYVSNWHSKKVYRYNGDPHTGYTLDENFMCEIADTLADSISVTDEYPGPWGMGLMPDKNLLFVSADYDYGVGGNYYAYGRHYVVDPNTGDLLDTIDVAKFYYEVAGEYTRPSTTSPGNVGGYTSTYNLDFDDQYNLYSQTYYGWAAEKWIYSGELPSIEIVGVELKSQEATPSEYTLRQNYPNPFNPTTTIAFDIPEPANVSLKIYSINGELLATVLDNRSLAQGAHEVSFDALNLASGVYIYALEADGVTLTKKMTVMK